MSNGAEYIRQVRYRVCAKYTSYTALYWRLYTLLLWVASNRREKKSNFFFSFRVVFSPKLVPPPIFLLISTSAVFFFSSVFSSIPLYTALFQRSVNGTLLAVSWIGLSMHFQDSFGPESVFIELKRMRSRCGSWPYRGMRSMQNDGVHREQCV